MISEQYHLHEFIALEKGDSNSLPVALWVPSNQVSIYQVQLPKVPRRKLPAMLPWALEDQLLQPPSEMHLVLLEGASDGIATVLAVPHREMHRLSLLASREDANLTAMVPDFLALAWEPGWICVASQGDHLLVRTDRYSGFCAPLDFAWDMVRRALLADASARLSLAGLQPDQVPLDLRERSLEGAAVNWRNAEMPLAANLLVGACRAKKSFPQVKAWAPSIAFAGIALLLLVSFVVFDYLKTGRELLEAETALTSRYQALFGELPPSMAGVRQAASRNIQRRELRYLATNSGIMDLLRGLDPMLSGCSGCRIANLRLSSDTATLVLIAEGGAGARAPAIPGWQVSLAESSVEGAQAYSLRRSP